MNTSEATPPSWQHAAGVGAVILLGGLGYYYTKTYQTTIPATTKHEEEKPKKRITAASSKVEVEDRLYKPRKVTLTPVDGFPSTMDNYTALQSELDWLSSVIAARMQLHFDQDGPYSSIEEVDEPDLSNNSSPYSQLVKDYTLDNYERLMLILALAPHCRPQVLDFFFTRNSTYERSFTEFGGIRDSTSGGFIPTFETLLFIVAGDGLPRRLRLQEYLLQESILTESKIIIFGPSSSNEPKLTSAPLLIAEEYGAILLSGKPFQLESGPASPAKRLTTNFELDDLVLDPETQHQIDDIKYWLDHSSEVINGSHLTRIIKPGYRVLFHGPPGTGKTLAASLLSKSTGMGVYQIDLCRIDSKYIGDTEKNLDRVFNQAEGKNWILFFDEADILFGRRTDIKTSNDRHANEKVAYLLQKMERFTGVVILATNKKENIDEAFMHRFQATIEFKMPDKERRVQLWKKAFKGVRMEEGMDWEEIGRRFGVSGAVIQNVLRYSVLVGAREENGVVRRKDVLDGLEREFRKVGKTVEQVSKETLD
eukprot:TRINITY_DN5887_c1_g1_i1.p1 TRINITY_DN5887_c1_g1~~TRINITY_DN5887_c1_g1_i1.p1  ORF type:complete len:537 (+),score=123.91 TRINITY_DN5887_c1_g1_i1:5-1615(+)